MIAPLLGFTTGILTILVVGLAGRRRDAALQLISAHSELTSDRTNGARGRLFRVNDEGALTSVYAQDSLANWDPHGGKPSTPEIDDYFVLLYAIEAAATAVDVACQRRGHHRLQQAIQPVRGVLPKKRAQYLEWHVIAITKTIHTWRDKAAQNGHLDDADSYTQHREHCKTLNNYGLLPDDQIPPADSPQT